VGADEIGRSLFHDSVIKRLMDMPAIGTVECRPFTTIQNAVFVQLSSSGISGVEIVWHEGCRPDSDIFWKPCVESSKPFPGRPLPLDAAPVVNRVVGVPRFSLFALVTLPLAGFDDHQSHA